MAPWFPADAGGRPLGGPVRAGVSDALAVARQEMPALVAPVAAGAYVAAYSAHLHDP